MAEPGLEGDTIAAIATPPGRGALALLRLSGPGTPAILQALVPALAGTLPPARTARLQTFVHPVTGEAIDRGLLVWFPAPHSYTGEDLAELSVHGGTLGPALLLEAALRAGARRARAGEFTQRGYLHGKVDLVQAEGIQDLVAAETDAARRAALAQTEGTLSRRLTELRQGIVHLEALLVYHIDFPEEDEPPVPIERIARDGRALEEQLRGLVATAPEGERLQAGALTVLAGRPNSGKSSLFNALLGEARAIVTAEPGTTRDAIEVGISVGGYPFRLVDTAGLREGVGEVERLGIEVARRYLARADLILLCLPADAHWGPGEARFLEEVGAGGEAGAGVGAEAVGRRPVLLLRTLVDRVGEAAVSSEGVPGSLAEGAISISVTEGTGLAELQRRLPALTFGSLLGFEGGFPVLTRRRHREGVERALEEVGAFAVAVERGLPAEIASTHLRSAETALEELLGIVTGEEILDRVFADFCIGK